MCSSSYMEPLYRSHLCAQVVQNDPKNPEGVCAVSPVHKVVIYLHNLHHERIENKYSVPDVTKIKLIVPF